MKALRICLYVLGAIVTAIFWKLAIGVFAIIAVAQFRRFNEAEKNGDEEAKQKAIRRFKTYGISSLILLLIFGVVTVVQSLPKTITDEEFLADTNRMAAGLSERLRSMTGPMADSPILIDGDNAFYTTKTLGRLPHLNANADFAAETLKIFKTTNNLLLYTYEAGGYEKKFLKRLIAYSEAHPEFHWVVVPGNRAPRLQR